MMRQSETMRAASRLLLSHPIVCLLAVVAAVVVLGVLGPLKVVHAAEVAVEGEKFDQLASGTNIVTGAAYSGGAALKFTADVPASSPASSPVNCSTPCDVVLMASGGQSGGQATFSVNGSTPQALKSTTPTAYTFHLPNGAGTKISVKAGGTGKGHNAFLDVAKFQADGGGAPSDFTNSQVVSGLTNPTDMEIAPDGRLFVAEQAGRVRIAKPDGTLSTFLNISTKVNSSGERGLQSLTFDPGFSTNRYVYLHYTKNATSTTPVHNRIVRVTADANGTKVVSGSEKLIFQLDNQTSDHHMGGAIDFGTDGKLYISTGDNETPDKAQQLTNLFGKMLRINKDGTIPTDNPYYPTASGNNRAIWALGLRNPFKFAVQPGTGIIYINDVGQDAWEEIDKAVPGVDYLGANYGWGFPTSPPYYEGIIASPDPALQNYNNPVLSYGHDGDIETTGCSITGGAFYNPTNATTAFASYQGKYFYTDFCSGWIRVFDPSSGTDSAIPIASGIVKPVDLEVGDNGSLYYLYRGSSSVPAAVRQIR